MLKNLWRWIPVAALLLIGGHTLAKANDASEYNWSVEDNISIDRLAVHMHGANYNIHRSGPGDPAFVYSFDKTLVAFNVQANDLENGQVVSRLRIYRVADLVKFADSGVDPKPIFEKKVASSSSLPGLGEFSWAPDSNAFFFLSLESNVAQLRVWIVGQKSDEPLEKFDGGVGSYQLIGDDKVALFRRLPASSALPKNAFDDEQFVATGHSIYAAILGYQSAARAEASVWPRRIEIYDWKTGKRISAINAIVNVGSGIGQNWKPLSVSPDGRRFAFAEITTTRNSGRCWRQDPIALRPFDRSLSNPDAVEIAFYDIRTGQISRPFNAPIGRTHVVEYSHVLWSHDSSMAIVPNTYTQSDECDDNRRTRPPGAYSFDFDEGKVSTIVRYRRDGNDLTLTAPREVVWTKPNRELTIRFRVWPFRLGSSSVKFPRRSFVWNGISWEPVLLASNDESLRANRPTGTHALEVREGHNTPPAIYAISASGKSRMLLDLSQQVRDRKLVEFKPVEWKDESGITWTGMLGLPGGYKSSDGRLPLLLQTYGYHENKFIAEGWTTIVYPGRAILERGFAVLIVKQPLVASRPMPEEGRNLTRGYRSAIAHLYDLGLIDRNRVGTIGWSRKSFHVQYALTTAPDLFAAAVLADGFNKSYTAYNLWIDGVATPRMSTHEFELTYGSDPWPLTDNWINEATGFNSHKIDAPVRIEAPSIRNILGEWELYAGLRAQGVPVDLIVYPDGRHALVRPKERQLSTQGSIDWLDFWINGVEDPDPAKTAQYERWRDMREERCVWGDQEEKPAYCAHHK